SLGSTAASAYTSTGADGAFQPTGSVVLDAAAGVFNFTDIDIPVGVTVTFSDWSSPGPIEFLATGDIHIAGTLDAGSYGLWIETPGTIFVSGSVASASSLWLYAAGAGGPDPITGGGSGSSASGSLILAGGGSIGGLGGGPVVVGGGGVVPGGGPGCTGGCTVAVTVPEPETWAMLSGGLAAMLALSRRRRAQG
ncbi:MAG TPA: PEP-CTERM sorting domain-containing protein, partial [Rhodocyclaceae bacterium]|nr:PEP-CTERM sorting domain-containing protein [Rhodocyclaceae bacterium]